MLFIHCVHCIDSIYKGVLYIDCCIYSSVYIYFLFLLGKQPEIFFSVLSESTWSEVLTDDQRQHLRQLLPHFQEDNTSEQDSTISKLFNKQNFCFGNPLHLAQKLFQGNVPPLSNGLILSTFLDCLWHISDIMNHCALPRWPFQSGSG